MHVIIIATQPLEDTPGTRCTFTYQGQEYDADYWSTSSSGGLDFYLAGTNTSADPFPDADGETPFDEAWEAYQDRLQAAYTTRDLNRLIDDAHAEALHHPGGEHTFLVALSVETDDATTRADAERLVHAALHPVTAADPRMSWWIAEDYRSDRSDSDSAVFVRPGRQDAARRLLAAAGLSASCTAHVREEISS